MLQKKAKTILCDCNVIHKDRVARVSKKMPDTEVLLDVADFYRVLGDSTRMGILFVLSQEEMCGCDICTILNMTQSAVSHQLRILKQARLVKYRKVGKIVYFRLDDDHIREIMSMGMAHIQE